MSLPNAEDQVLLLHNPRCSKSRATLDLLEARGVSFQTRLYLESPLDAEELRELGRRLGRPPIEFTRTKQAEFAAGGWSEASGDPALLAAIAATPILMERPIVVRGERAVIGRPPEAVLALFD